MPGFVLVAEQLSAFDWSAQDTGPRADWTGKRLENKGKL